MCPKFLETGLVTESIDIYAFGVVLCELLTGSPPYDRSRDRPGIVEHLRNSMISPCHLQEAVDPVAKWRKRSCTSFARVAIACVKRDPRDRPPNMGSIIQDVEQILDSTVKQYQHLRPLTAAERTSGDLEGVAACSIGENQQPKLLSNDYGGCYNKTSAPESLLNVTTAVATAPSSPRVASPPLSPFSSYNTTSMSKKELLGGDLIQLETDSASISCKICPLSIYGLPIEQIGDSFRWGSLLASNPRLLCLCSRMTNNFSVHILDLWEMEKGRVVKFGSSTPLKAANISPCQSETFIAAQVCVYTTCWYCSLCC